MCTLRARYPHMLTAAVGGVSLFSEGTEDDVLIS